MRAIFRCRKRIAPVTPPGEYPSTVRGMAVTQQSMERTCTDLRDGCRLAVTAEFITRRVIDGCHRLLLADSDGTRFVVLATPEREPQGLRSGETYRLVGLLGVDPTGAGEGTGRCSCGGEFRPGRTLDVLDSGVREAVSRLDIEEPFGVLDAAATVQARDVPVDNWVPPGPRIPDRVCRSCGQEVVSDPPADDAGRPADPPSGPVSLRAVERGYTPRPATLADDRLFDGHAFTPPLGGESDGLFTPAAGVVTGEHPVDGDSERYLAVTLDSGLPVEEFERPPLDLVVVLDRSRSMARPLDGESGDCDRTKLGVAKRALCDLLDHLREDDRLGIVLREEGGGHVASPLRPVGGTDRVQLQEHVRALDAGTEVAPAGFETGLDLLADADSDGREARLLGLSDLRADDSALVDRLADGTADGVHATLAPVGFDADVALARRLSTVRGGSYRPVTSAPDLLGAFDRLVTPAVHDLALGLDTAALGIERVHASPPAERCSDSRVHVGTAFPRHGESGSLQAGFVLARVTGPADVADLMVSWTEPGGGEHVATVTLDFGTTIDSLRPAADLAACGRELRAWATDRHAPSADGGRPVTDGRVESADGWPDQTSPGRTRPVPRAVLDRRARRFDRLRAALAAHEHGFRHELSLLDALR